VVDHVTHGGEGVFDDQASIKVTFLLGHICSNCTTKRSTLEENKLLVYLGSHQFILRVFDELIDGICIEFKSRFVWYNLV
jgi:hypothetical protein